jgi:hypothetical protein
MIRYIMLLFIALADIAYSQETHIPDLKALVDGNGALLDSQVVQWVNEIKGKSALKIAPEKVEFSQKDQWLVILPGIKFTDGVIELDILGQSGPPQSNFVGVAFHVVDESTYDAIYFRPFNFRADDPARRLNAVQYVSHPKYPWYVLRESKPRQYEKPVISAPDGDDWFHAKIVIQKPKVSVYVNDAKEPSLVVDKLSDQKGQGIALWVGPGRGGHFANLKITPAK